MLVGDSRHDTYVNRSAIRSNMIERARWLGRGALRALLSGSTKRTDIQNGRRLWV